ncbi:MAG: DUF167 domain-containing protein [Sphingomonadales bacterium]|nr:DUF167 domain-containing protein [Sphingomonadales bacterium]
MPVRRDGADLLLAIRLSPRAARERIGGTFTDSAGQRWLQASVTAPPDKGKANAALIALLARLLKRPASSIFLETGDTNRLKRLRLADAGPQAEQSLREIAEQERSGT